MNDVKNGMDTPYNNMGCLRTSGSALRACVDWVQVTFKNIVEPNTVLDILGFNSSDFTYFDYGNKFYRKKMSLGQIKIFYDGIDSSMGVHLEMSGQGCREFEQTFTNNKDWSLFFALLFNWDIHFSRLDVAIDDFYGYFTIKNLVDKVKKGHVRSLFRKARNLEEYFLRDGSLAGHTLYFGKSDVIFRFYNKYLERLSKGKVLEDDVKFWNRYEIQLRDDQAHSAGLLIAFQHTDIGNFAKGVFSRYLNFLIPSTTDSNKRRWKLAKFWTDFLGDVEKISLSQVAPDRTVEKAENWVNRQVSPTLAMLYKAYNFDDKKIMEFIKEGMDRLTDNHEDMIKRFQLNSKTKLKLVSELREIKKMNLLKAKKIR